MIDINELKNVSNNINPTTSLTQKTILLDSLRSTEKGRQRGTIKGIPLSPNNPRIKTCRKCKTYFVSCKGRKRRHPNLCQACAMHKIPETARRNRLNARGGKESTAIAA